MQFVYADLPLTLCPQGIPLFASGMQGSFNQTAECFACVAFKRIQLTYDEFNYFCRTLPAATYVNQWGGSHVWKVGGKVFAIGGWADEEARVTFKVTDIAYEMLGDQPGLRPAPYFASRGMKWIQHYSKPGLPDEDLKDYLRQSHRIVSLGLSKKKQKELELS